MQMITLDAAAADAMRGADPGFDFNDQCLVHPDGSWSVPMSDDTLERLEQHRLAGETLSHLVVRLTRFRRTGHH